jgi:hypothetical protein
MTKIPYRSSAGPSRGLIAGIVIVGLISMVNLVAMVLFAISKVHVGQGHETYRTFWLVEDDYIGFLIFFACVLAALGVGLTLRLVQQRRERRAWLQHDRRWTQNSGA